jgi:hypothetical protein
MSVGLLADAAFAQWKQQKYSDSLSLYVDILGELSNILLSEELYTRHLHATVRHSIAWLHSQAMQEANHMLTEPYPGMCSNQNPSKGIQEHKIIPIHTAWILLKSTHSWLGLSSKITTEIDEINTNAIPINSKLYECAFGFELMFKKKKFISLIEKLIEITEFETYLRTKHSGDDGWEPGKIPSLPYEFWENAINRARLFHYMLLAALIAATGEETQIVPVDKWRSDLSNNVMLYPDVTQFLFVLEGEKPDNSLYQQAAASVLTLRETNIAPVTLWKALFRLVNVFMTGDRFVVEPLSELAVRKWLNATANQRFAFSAPSLFCPMIEACCRDSTISGLAKVAAILEVSAQPLGLQLSTEVKSMLRKISYNRKA